MPLNIDVQQIFLHLFNFTILFGGLYFLLYNPVKTFMDKRERYYYEMDRQAKEKLMEAENIKAYYQQKLGDADKAVQEYSDRAMESAMESTRQMMEQSKAQADRILAQARAEAKAERERAIREARVEIAEMVTEATGKLMLESTSDAYDQFLAGTREDESNA